MEPFTTHTGIVATLDTANVDTDQIIAKQFLKLIGRTGFGQYLFYDWRYLADGRENPDFPLNRPQVRGASILVTRDNFGCGSSREHAVWAVQQYGFRAIVAPWREHGAHRLPGFADIFRNNCGKNGLLTIELPEPEVEKIFAACGRTPGLRATVDLPLQTLTFLGAEPLRFSFDVHPALKNRLVNGLDDISLTLREADAIDRFEKQNRQWGHFPQVQA
ncbi:MAG: 3-isopropylmalate dehydratase small subunit [Candidatus Omnitrophota bacterium]|jgi:3-isopropylmalate/(R)-2-methylmalate dehydratase small subunit